jgi:hypothetical protein
MQQTSTFTASQRAPAGEGKVCRLGGPVNIGCITGGDLPEKTVVNGGMIVERFAGCARYGLTVDVMQQRRSGEAFEIATRPLEVAIQRLSHGN